MKKILSGILIILILISTLPLTVLGDEVVSSDTTRITGDTVWNDSVPTVHNNQIKVDSNQTVTISLNENAIIGANASISIRAGGTLKIIGTGTAKSQVRARLNLEYAGSTIELNNINWDLNNGTQMKEYGAVNVNNTVTIKISGDTRIVGKNGADGTDTVNGISAENNNHLQSIGIKNKKNLTIEVLEGATLTVIGGNALAANANENGKYYGGAGIYSISGSTTTFKGAGNINIYGGKGSDGYSYTSTATTIYGLNGTNGFTGAFGIYNLGTINVEMTSDTTNKGIFSVTGGTGGNGGTGEKAKECSHTLTGSACNVTNITRSGNGGNGGNSSTGIYGEGTSILNIKSGNVYVYSGYPGNKGDAGEVNNALALTYGGTTICQGNHSFKGLEGINGDDKTEAISGGNLNVTGGTVFCYGGSSKDNTTGVSVTTADISGGSIYCGIKSDPDYINKPSFKMPESDDLCGNGLNCSNITSKGNTAEFYVIDLLDKSQRYKVFDLEFYDVTTPIDGYTYKNENSFCYTDNLGKIYVYVPLNYSDKLKLYLEDNSTDALYEIKCSKTDTNKYENNRLSFWGEAFNYNETEYINGGLNDLTIGENVVITNKNELATLINKYSSSVKTIKLTNSLNMSLLNFQGLGTDNKPFVSVFYSDNQSKISGINRRYLFNNTKNALIYGIEINNGALIDKATGTDIIKVHISSDITKDNYYPFVNQGNNLSITGSYYDGLNTDELCNELTNSKIYGVYGFSYDFAKTDNKNSFDNTYVLSQKSYNQSVTTEDKLKKVALTNLYSVKTSLNLAIVDSSKETSWPKDLSLYSFIIDNNSLCFGNLETLDWDSHNTKRLKMLKDEADAIQKALDDEIAKEQEYNNLLAQIEKNTAELASKSDIIDALTASLASTTSLLNQTKAEKDLALSSLTSLQNELTKLKSAKAEDEAKIAKLEGDIKAANEKIASLTNLIETIKAKKDEALSSCTNLEKEIASKTSIISKKNEEIASLTNVINNANTKIENLKKEKATLTDALEKERQDKEEAITVAEDLQKKLDKTKDEYGTLTNLYNKATSENDQLKTQLQLANIKLASNTNEINLLSSEKTALLSSITNLETKISELNEDKEKSTEDINKLNENVTKLNLEIASLTNTVNDEKAKNTKLSDDLSSAKASLASATTVITNQKAYNNKLAASITSLNKEIAAKDKENKDLIATLTNVKKDYEDKLTNVNSALYAEKASNSNLSANLSRANATITNLLAYSNKLVASITSLNNEIAAKNKENKDLIASLTNLKNNYENKLNNVNKALEAEKASSSNLSSNLSSATASITNLQAYSNKLLASITSLNNEIDKKNKENKGLIATITNIKKEYEDKLTKSNDALTSEQNKVTKLNEKIETLNNQLASSTNIISSLNEDKAFLLASVTNLKTIISDKSQDINKKQSTINDLSKELELKKNELASTTNLLNKEKANNEKALNLVSELEIKLGSATDLVNSLNIENNNLLSKKKLLEETIKKAEEVKAKDDKTIQELKDTITKNENNIASLTTLTETLAKNKSDLEKDLLKSNEDIASLTNILAISKTKIDELTQKEDKAKNDLTSANKTITELNEKISNLSKKVDTDSIQINELETKIYNQEEKIKEYENLIERINQTVIDLKNENKTLKEQKSITVTEYVNSSSNKKLSTNNRITGELVINYETNSYILNNQEYKLRIPLIKDNQDTYLYIKDITDILGIREEDVTWDKYKGCAYIIKDNNLLTITPGLKIITEFDGKMIKNWLASANSMLVNNRIFVPVSAIFEILSYNVNINDKNTIIKKLNIG